MKLLQIRDGSRNFDINIEEKEILELLEMLRNLSYLINNSKLISDIPKHFYSFDIHRIIGNLEAITRS